MLWADEVKKFMKLCNFLYIRRLLLFVYNFVAIVNIFCRQLCLHLDDKNVYIPTSLRTMTIRIPNIGHLYYHRLLT